MNEEQLQLFKKLESAADAEIDLIQQVADENAAMLKVLTDNESDSIKVFSKRGIEMINSIEKIAIIIENLESLKQKIERNNAIQIFILDQYLKITEESNS